MDTTSFKHAIECHYCPVKELRWKNDDTLLEIILEGDGIKFPPGFQGAVLKLKNNTVMDKSGRLLSSTDNSQYGYGDNYLALIIKSPGKKNEKE